jgi:hypothetical protein
VDRELAPQWNTVFVKDDDNPEIAMTGQSDVIAHITVATD